jgi:hypothetical protein
MDTFCFDLKTYQISLLFIVINRANTTQSTILHMHWQDSGKPNSNESEFRFLCEIICFSIRNGYVLLRPASTQYQPITKYKIILLFIIYNRRQLYVEL